MIKLKFGSKTSVILTVLAGLILLFAISFSLDFSREEVKWGVTFSPVYAQYELGLDWQVAYLAILDELNVDHVRLSAYWNRIEEERDKYNFYELDWQVEQASQREVDIIIGLGRRLPRWPECHDPRWLADLPPEETRTEQLEVVKLIIERYESNPRVKMWQVENEPFLTVFGECPPLDRQALDEEIELVRTLSAKPLMITDSGELNFWVEAAQTGADVIGSTLYRVVYNEKIGYLRYPLPPLFYYAKAVLIKALFNTQEIINSELQAEAWHTAATDLRKMTLAESFQSMDLKQFQKNIAFAKRAGFGEIYLWGAEWWYFLKEQRNYPEFWEEAKKLWP